MNWWNELIFTCSYKFRKAKCYCIVVDMVKTVGVGMVKTEGVAIDHGILKSVVSHKLFDKLSTLTEWLLHVNGDAMKFGLRVILLCIFDI